MTVTKSFTDAFKPWATLTHEFVTAQFNTTKASLELLAKGPNPEATAALQGFAATAVAKTLTTAAEATRLVDAQSKEFATQVKPTFEKVANSTLVDKTNEFLSGVPEKIASFLDTSAEMVSPAKASKRSR